jgi:hypothetical protein
MFIAPARLGVGCSYFPSAPEILGHVRDLIDFVEISPDMLCREFETELGGGRLVFLPDMLRSALTATEHLPLTVHGLELSIGTAAGWNESYLDILDRFSQLREFPWHSEHLGYLLAQQADGQIVNAGVPLPLPFTQEAVDCVAPRAEYLVERYGRPFLLENATYYLPNLTADPGWDEIVFLNRLVEQSSCGLLLDVYNLYCNSRNHGFDLLEALSRLRLDRVVEVHVAGGKTHDGFVLDSHSAAVPEPVWEALEWLVPRAPNLAGVLYEVMEPAFPLVGLEALRRQLERLRQIWQAQPAAPAQAATSAATSPAATSLASVRTAGRRRAARGA